MTVISRPGQPLAMVCDRCGCEWPRPALDEHIVTRCDAEMHGWTYDADLHGDRHVERDTCPRCNGVYAAEDEDRMAHLDAAGPEEEL